MLYLVIGKAGHPCGGLLGSEAEAQAIASEFGGGYLSLQEPWEYVEAMGRGQGVSPFGSQKDDLTTMRVPRAFVEQVRKYAVWLTRMKTVENTGED